MKTAVEIDHVTKSFGKFIAVDDLSLTVPSGCVYGFIGPNGSGKTTTLRMITRIYIPDSGTVKVLGEDRHGPTNDKVAYLPEERGLYNQMKVRDLLKFYSEIRGHKTSRDEISSWLEKLRLVGTDDAGKKFDWGDKPVRTLSKGMSQKVQFIATVIAKPQLVLLDEPFSGLDPLNAVVLREQIAELKKSGTTVIFSTHDMRVAQEMCDYIFMIYKGKKVLDGTLESIRRQWGRDVLRVRMPGVDRSQLTRLTGVLEVTDKDNEKEIQMSPSADPQLILRELVSIGRLDHFEVASPSLQDIFVRIAGDSADVSAAVTTMA